MITRMNHMSFTVSNLERSVDFYHNTLGLELKGSGPGARNSPRR